LERHDQNNLQILEKRRKIRNSFATIDKTTFFAFLQLHNRPVKSKS
jgi:hypothetical protein